jgi:hypothetical protein
MKKYLSVAVGTSPGEAHEIFFSDDDCLIELLFACLKARVEGHGVHFTTAEETALVAMH